MNNSKWTTIFIKRAQRKRERGKILYSEIIAKNITSHGRGWIFIYKKLKEPQAS